MAENGAIVKTKAVGLLSGVVFGWTLAWTHLTDPRVIREMLLLKDAHVFLIMGTAVAVAAIGVRVLKAFAARTLVTGERIAWAVERPQKAHIGGSVLFALGWTIAGTCPGPVAAMVGAGGLAGLPVMIGLIAGVTLHRVVVKRTNAKTPMATPAPAGL
jgi:uncharacterized membrane protein YedE/YeeE